MCVDLVRDLAAPGGRLVPEEAEALDRYARAIENVVRVQEAARAGGVLVVHARTAYAEGYPSLNRSTITGQLIEARGAQREGDPGSDWVVAPVQGDRVVTKRMISAFAGTDLDVMLRAAHVDTVVCVGFVTHLAVEGTARDAADRGYTVVIVHDACASAGPQRHQAALDVLSRLCALVSTDDWCAGVNPAISPEELTGTSSWTIEPDGV